MRKIELAPLALASAVYFSGCGVPRPTSTPESTNSNNTINLIDCINGPFSTEPLNFEIKDGETKVFEVIRPQVPHDAPFMISSPGAITTHPEYGLVEMIDDEYDWGLVSEGVSVLLSTHEINGAVIVDMMAECLV